MAKKEKKLFFRDDGTILVKGVTASYLHLFEPWAKKPSEPKKFSGRFIMPAKDFADEIEELKQWGLAKQKEAFKGRIKSDALFYRDGDELGKEEYENAWYIAASEKEDNQPQLLRPDRKPAKKSEDLLYSGAVVNIIIRPWVQDNEHGRRINANLLVVQHKAHGKKFGNAGAPVDNDGLDDEEFEGANDAELDDDGFGGDDD